MMKRSIIKTLAFGSIFALALTACNDQWNEHYQEKAELNSTETLWDIITSRGELSEFAAMLKKTGYDKLLTQNRYYTIWAPKNGFGYSEANDSLLRVEFVENHIADYSYNASGRLEENQVKMINGKYNYFDGAGDNYTFKGRKLISRNIPAKNGVLHIIDGYANFTANIWEQLAKVDSLSEINSFLKSFNIDYFDEAQSVQGPIVNGQITYLDSVVTLQNEWFSYIGYLAREDSSYYMIAPTNKAWRSMYDKALTYFTYPSTKDGGDSLQRLNAASAMCRHLVFSRMANRLKVTDDPKTKDSLSSNWWQTRNSSFPYKKTFRGEEYHNLFNNLVQVDELSNGTLYVTDTYNFDPIKCWHDTIRIEGEDMVNVEVSSGTADMVAIPRDSVTLYKKFSRGVYGVFAPTANKGNPKVTVAINKVLSAPYLVKCVFVPANIIDKTATTMPNLFTVQLKYVDLDGKTKTMNMGTKIENWTDSCYNQLDTVTFIPQMDEAHSFFRFPTNEYDLSNSEIGQTQLTITSAMTSKDSDHDRTIRIDCIILEPIDEETFVDPLNQQGE